MEVMSQISKLLPMWSQFGRSLVGRSFAVKSSTPELYPQLEGHLDLYTGNPTQKMSCFMCCHEGRNSVEERNLASRMNVIVAIALVCVLIILDLNTPK